MLKKIESGVFGPGKGRLMALLRGRQCTVGDLARTLALTDNAVRAQLVALQKAGFAVRTGLRAGARRPHETFSLTPGGEGLFQKRFEQVLGALVDVLAQRMQAKEFEAALGEVADRLADGFGPPPPPSAGIRQRLHRAVEVVADLGGASEIADGEGPPALRGLGCPLGGLVTTHPEACRMAARLLSRATGLKLRERCEKSPVPRCRFEVISGLSRGEARLPARKRPALQDRPSRSPAPRNRPG